MRNVRVLAAVLLFVAVTNDPVRADCSKKHIYLSLASDSLDHMIAYSNERNDDMMMAARNEGIHWYDMAHAEPCSHLSRADASLESYLKEPFDEDARQARQLKEEQALIRERKHAAMVHAAWARAHPSKWALAHPGQTPNPYAKHPDQAANLVRLGPDTHSPNLALAQQQGIQGMVTVLVSLDERGHVTNAVVQSSPSPLLNEAALADARNAVYTPEIKNGHAVPATYVFVMDFTSM